MAIDMKIKQYRNLFENWQRHVHEEETVSQEPERVIEIPAPPPVQNPQMDDEEMDRIMAEVVEGRKVVKEQPLLQEKAKHFSAQRRPIANSKHQSTY